MKNHTMQNLLLCSLSTMYTEKKLGKVTPFLGIFSMTVLSKSVLFSELFNFNHG